MQRLLYIVFFATTCLVYGQKRIEVKLSSIDVENGNIDLGEESNHLIAHEGNFKIEIGSINNIAELFFSISGTSQKNVGISTYSVTENKKELVDQRNFTVFESFREFSIKKSLFEIDKIQIEFEVDKSDTVFIKNINAFTPSEKEVNAYNIDKAYDERKELEERENIEDEVEKFRKVIEKGFPSYHQLLFKYNSLSNVNNTVLFINARSDQINPLSYSSFTEKMNLIIDKADESQKKSINQFLTKLETEKSKLKQKNNGIKNIFGFAGSLLNILSGNRISSICDNLITLTTGVFDKDDIKSRHSTIVREGYRQYAEEVDSNLVDIEMRLGTEVQDYLDTLFNVIDKEQGIYLDLISNFSSSEASIQNKSANLLEDLEDLYQKLNIPYNDKDVTELSKKLVSDKKMGILQDSISSFCDDLLEMSTEKAEPILTEIGEIIKKLNGYENDYINQSSVVYENFLKFSSDLTRDNPFKHGTKLYSEFEGLRSEASTRYIPLINSLNKTLEKPNRITDYEKDLKKLNIEL